VVGRASSDRLRRQRNLILVSLLTLAAISWVVVTRQAGMTSGAGPTMGMTIPLFLVAWVAMMVAMMFPTAAPMILMFAAVSVGKKQRGESFVRTWIFVGSYLLVWIGFGAFAYGVAVGLDALSRQLMWVMDNAARLGGLLLLSAGVYQLSPLKNICLTKCRSPLSFILTAWRDGHSGAIQMGLAHGAYCLGCCWLLFAILFPLGIMNIAVMLGLTLLIFAEKSLPVGTLIGRLAGAALIGYGAFVMFVPHALPGMTM
jgi:predicted metal-binding membrane protein